MEPPTKKARDESDRTCYLFVGNPGVGKSTFLNNFIGQKLFKSGLSRTGGGVTFQLDTHEVPGKGIFMDTPGLADDGLREQAAAAITEALKKNGFYRIFFVVTLEAGRIHTADKTTMKLILSAAPITNYSIIFNKVTKRWVNEVLQDKDMQTAFMTKLITDLPRGTNSIYYMVKTAEIDDEDDALFSMPADVKAFIQDAPGMHIKASEVKDVPASEFAELEKEMEAKLKAMDADRELLKQRMEEERQRMQEIVEAGQKHAEEIQRRADEDRRIMREEMDGVKREAAAEREAARRAAQQRPQVQVVEKPVPICCVQ